MNYQNHPGISCTFSVPSMIEGLPFTDADECFGLGREMLVFMEPYLNVVPNGCALLLHAMERIKASGQPCIAQQVVLPHVEAFSSNFLLQTAGCIIRIIDDIIVILLLHLRMLLSGGPMLMLLCAIASLGVGQLRGRLGVGLLLLGVAGLGGIRVFHLLILIAPSSSLASVMDDVEHLPVCVVRRLPRYRHCIK